MVKSSRDQVESIDFFGQVIKSSSLPTPTFDEQPTSKAFATNHPEGVREEREGADEEEETRHQQNYLPYNPQNSLELHPASDVCR